jgi:hypothetical protein
MKVADLKIVKAIDSFMSFFFKEKLLYTINSVETSKSNNNEKGDYSIVFDCSYLNIPDILDQDDYSTVMKKKLNEILSKELRWLCVSWTFKPEIETVSFTINFKVS